MEAQASILYIQGMENDMSEKDKPAGAGFEGTPRLVKRYKRETPGQPVDEVYRKSGLGKWFHGEKAKGTEPGWDRYNSKGERIGKCGDAKEGEAYAACLSRQKAAKLGKKKVASFVNRKRAAQRAAGDPKKGGESTKGDKPVFVKTGITDKDPNKKGIQDMMEPIDFLNVILEELLYEKNKPTNPALWAKAQSLAKSKFDVHPSAYSNAWASKWYKSEGGGWVAEEVELDELKMPKGGIDKGTFKNPGLALKLLAGGGKGKRPRKPQDRK